MKAAETSQGCQARCSGQKKAGRRESCIEIGREPRSMQQGGGEEGRAAGREETDDAMRRGLFQGVDKLIEVS